MIGKPSWFKIRKWGGWGITPDSWQGWVYLGVMIIPFAIFQALPYWSEELRSGVTAAWLLVLLVDVVDIMVRMKKDEREFMHEAVAERNAAWFMVAIITAYMVYQLISSGLRQELYIDPVLLTALFGGAAVKSLTHWRLKNK